MKKLTIVLAIASSVFAQPTTLTTSTGDPVHITGNAGSASKLKTPRAINGVQFDGTSNINISLSSAPAIDVNAESRYQVAVTLLRPSKVKWLLGDFGTFTVPERIYVRMMNVARLGANPSIYVGSWYGPGSLDPLRPQVFTAGQTIQSLNAAAFLCYVTETDVAAVTNASQIYHKMEAHLLRQSAAPRLFQARAPGTGSGSGGASRKDSHIDTPVPIVPGPHGSMVMEMIGSGYQGGIFATVSGARYNALNLAPAVAGEVDLTTTPVSNHWLYTWWPRMLFSVPIAAAMDDKTFDWNLRVYSADANFDGQINATVIDLPDWWDSNTL